MTCLESVECEGCGREICLLDDIGGHDDYLTVCVRPGKSAIYCGKCPQGAT